MFKKYYLTFAFYLIKISSLLIFYSCQSEQNKSVTSNQIETKESIDSIVNIVPDVEPEETHIDTLTVQDRFLEGDNFHSHIKLDFAKATTKIKDSSQIRTFDKICAVSVIPDTSWIKEKKNEMGVDWNEIVSDNQYYEQLAIDTLEAQDIPSYFASRDKRFISFIKKDKSSFTIDLTKMEDAWGLILFNRVDDPVLWSNTDIDSELKEIYKK